MCSNVFIEDNFRPLYIHFLDFGKMPAWQAGRTKGQYWKYLVWGSLTVTTQQVWTAAKLGRQFCPVFFMVSFGVHDMSEDENKTFCSLESLKYLSFWKVLLLSQESFHLLPLPFVSVIPQKFKKAYLGIYLWLILSVW